MRGGMGEALEAEERETERVEGVVVKLHDCHGQVSLRRGVS